MNFDSIEGLTEKEIMKLFDEDVEQVSTYYGYYCWTYYNFADSKCINSFSNTFTKCPIDCTNSIIFSNEALTAKCNSYCGGNTSSANININFVETGGSWGTDGSVNCNSAYRMHDWNPPDTPNWIYADPAIFANARCYTTR